MRLHCPKCASEIAAADINIHRLVAKCSQCDNVFGFDTASAPKQFAAEPTPKPAGVKRKVVDDTLHLSWDWHTPWAIPAVFSAAFALWYFSDARLDLWIAMIDIICLGVIYWCITTWVNSTTVTVDPTQVRITHGPLPWRSPKPVESTAISQLYAGKYQNPMYEVHFRSEYFAVNMIRRGAGEERLLGGLDSAHLAIYLEQQIEEFLGIADRPVSGGL